MVEGGDYMDKKLMRLADSIIHLTWYSYSRHSPLVAPLFNQLANPPITSIWLNELRE